MNRGQAIDRFELNHKLGVNQKIHDQIVTQDDALVCDWHSRLRQVAYPAQTKLNAESLLIDRLQQSRAKESMHFDGCPNDLFRQRIAINHRLPRFCLENDSCFLCVSSLCVLCVSVVRSSYLPSTVTAMTTGAVVSGPFTSSISRIAASRFGSIAR